jgi:hypothetical protein
MNKTNYIFRIICVLTILVMLSTLISGCGKESTGTAYDADPFVPIEGEEINGLVYHRQSKTVYVLLKEANGYQGYGYLAEYIVNGHYTEYIDGKIIEVIPEYEQIIQEKAPKTADEKWASLTQEEKEALLKME